MPIILDGKALAHKTESDLCKRVERIKEEKGLAPTLATILVGSDPASQTYVKMKGNACKRIGMNSLKIELNEDITTDDLLEKINELNDNPEVHGILLQHPPPQQINERKCFDAINLDKDVDGVTSLGFGKMTMGEKTFGSCTPLGIIRLLDYYKIEIASKHAVVVGRSPILGKPMAMMLLNKHATVTICHSKTTNLPERVLQAISIL